jgi:hypothetical protein
VEVAVSEQIWGERTPQPPAEVFSFQLSKAGYRRLRAYLQSTIVSDERVKIIGPSRFYPARESHHLFHQCHQYAAQALREAGLPITAWTAVSRGAFAKQLRRAERHAARKQSALTGIYFSGGTSIVTEAA